MNISEKSEILEKLARKLQISGPLTARALQDIAGVSQPQLSRYLKLLETQILRIGRGKNTQYVHTREIPQVGNQIPLFNVNKKGKLEQEGTLYPIFPKGFYWLSKNPNLSRAFDDLPYFLNDLRPSGFLGRLVPRTYPDWGFPEDIRLWTADSTLRYLTHFGIDLIGDQIIGEIAAQKFLHVKLQQIPPKQNITEMEQYETLAQKVETLGIPGSSAGGEHPKFVTQRLLDGAHVIVKFVRHNNNEITRRRIDLLRAEDIAAKLLSTIESPTSTRMIEGDAYTFLEIVRFDRTGAFGRKGMISLLSLDAEFLGSGESWGVVAQKLSNLKIFDTSIAQEIQFREYFGHCIGNTDMHGGNLSFFFEKEKVLGLTPVYDMLPMKYAPVQERISSETITPSAPKPTSVSVWEKARELAIRYWQQVQATEGFTSEFVDIAQRNTRFLSNISSR